VDIPGTFEAKGIEDAKSRLKFVAAEVREPFPAEVKDAEVRYSSDPVLGLWWWTTTGHSRPCCHSACAHAHFTGIACVRDPLVTQHDCCTAAVVPGQCLSCRADMRRWTC